MTETKKWKVEYAYDDGRNGTVEVITEVQESGSLIVDNHKMVYDFRYEKGDLHKVMLNDYFGSGLKRITLL